MDEKTYSRLLQLLQGLDFANAFYRRYAEKKGGECVLASPEQVAGLLDILGATPSYDAREDVFVVKGVPKRALISCRLSVCVRETVEFAMDFNRTGGSFHLLAEDVMHLTDPNFRHVPPYPRLEYSDGETLHAQLEFGFQWFEKVIAALEDASPPVWG